MSSRQRFNLFSVPIAFSIFRGRELSQEAFLPRRHGDDGELRSEELIAASYNLRLLPLLIRPYPPLGVGLGLIGVCGAGVPVSSSESGTTKSTRLPGLSLSPESYSLSLSSTVRPA